MKAEKSWIIINPNSGGGNALKQKELIQAKAIEMGWQGKYVETSPEKSAKIWVAEAIKSGVKHIIIGGGDGTIREILKPVSLGKITLGIIPLGTGNVLAGNLGIPVDTEAAIRVALHGKIKDMDMGEVNGNYFGVIVSMGVDVAMMGNTTAAMKNRWGILAYLWTGIQSLAKIGKKYRVTIDNKDSFIVRAKSVAIANMARTVAGIEIAKGAGPLSGDLKVVVVKPWDFKSWANLLFNAFRGNVNKSPYYEIYKAHTINITSLGRPQRFECDGDEFPPTKQLDISFHPKALRTRLPASNMGSEMVGEKKKILIFDFDGTLADTLQTMIRVFNYLAGRYGLPIMNTEQMENLRGQSAKEVVESLRINKLRLPGMLAAGRKEFIRLQENVNIFPGIKAALFKLKSKYGLGIVTSNDVKNVNTILKRNNLQIFDFIYSDRTIFGKGKILKNLIRKYNFENKQLIYFGDEVRDIDAARESHIKVVAVGWGFNTKEVLLKNKPDWWVEKPNDLTKLDF